MLQEINDQDAESQAAPIENIQKVGKKSTSPLIQYTLSTILKFRFFRKKTPSSIGLNKNGRDSNNNSDSKAKSTNNDRSDCSQITSSTSVSSEWSCSDDNNNSKNIIIACLVSTLDMDNVIKRNLECLLEASTYEEAHDFCDFSLQDQNEAALAKGVQPSVPADYKPVVKKSVTYIVAAVLFNERREVLMMQEAKSSCAGEWYLPAGRMEVGEDITEAAKREVLEETGLEFEPTTLITVESAGGSWYRFVVTGNITGGRLKTPADADSESLQAKWIGDLNELVLRSKDILPLIERGIQFTERRPSEPWHNLQLPGLRAHDKLLLRLVVMIRKKANNRVNVLASERTAMHFPVCEINPIRSVHATLKKFMTEIFGADLPQHKPHGLLSVEHTGNPPHTNDGCCLTLLVSVRDALEDVCLIDKYSWVELESRLGEELLARMGKNRTVPLTVIR